MTTLAIHAGTRTKAHIHFTPAVPVDIGEEDFLNAVAVLVDDGQTRLRFRHASIGKREIPADQLPHDITVPPVLHKFLGVSAGITAFAVGLMIFANSISRWVSGAIVLGFLGITLSVWREIRSWETGEIG